MRDVETAKLETRKEPLVPIVQTILMLSSYSFPPEQAATTSSLAPPLGWLVRPTGRSLEPLRTVFSFGFATSADLPHLSLPQVLTKLLEHLLAKPLPTGR